MSKTTPISDVVKEVTEAAAATTTEPTATTVTTGATATESTKVTDTTATVTPTATTIPTSATIVTPAVTDTKPTIKINTPATTKTATAVKVATTTPEAKETNVSAAAMYMRDYISRYLTINDGYLTTETKRRQTIEAFRQICVHALKHPEVDVLDQVVNFFVSNRNKVLSEELALQGIRNYNREEHAKLSAFYRLFYDYTNPTRKKNQHPNLDMVRNILKSDALINYLVQKYQY